MFGYIKIHKPQLLQCEFNRYRSVYCGLCKSLSKHYGQLPRFTVTYDVTFFLLLIESIEESKSSIVNSSCILHPFSQHPIEENNELLKAGAALSVILAVGKLEDNLIDKEKIASSHLLRALFNRAYNKAKNDYPALTSLVNSELKKLTEAENNQASLENNATIFGHLCKTALVSLATSCDFDSKTLSSLQLLAKQLGKWIYILDALEDFDKDIRAGRYSFTAMPSQEQAIEKYLPQLLNLEADLEKIAALLPYKKDASIIANIILDGLPASRQKSLQTKNSM